MTRTMLIAAALLAFTAGSYAQPLFNMLALRVTASRPVWDTFGNLTPLQAHYILDEWNGKQVCSRVLYHESGQFAVSDVPVAFCEAAQ